MLTSSIKQASLGNPFRNQKQNACNEVKLPLSLFPLQNDRKKSDRSNQRAKSAREKQKAEGPHLLQLSILMSTVYTLLVSLISSHPNRILDPLALLEMVPNLGEMQLKLKVGFSLACSPCAVKQQNDVSYEAHQQMKSLNTQHI